MCDVIPSLNIIFQNNSASSLFDGTPTGEADGPPNLSSVWSTPDVPPMTKGVDTSHEVLTTLDRPRTQSGVGTPIRPAWVQVCGTPIRPAWVQVCGSRYVGPGMWVQVCGSRYVGPGM